MSSGEVIGGWGDEFAGYAGTGVTNLMVVVSRGLVDLLPETLSMEIVNKQNKFGNTALHFALKPDYNYTIIQYLLDNGADVNISNNDGITPLMLFDQLAAKDNKFKALMAFSYIQNASIDIITEIFEYLPLTTIIDIMNLLSPKNNMNSFNNNRIWTILYERDYQDLPDNFEGSVKDLYVLRFIRDNINKLIRTKQNAAVIDFIDTYRPIINNHIATQILKITAFYENLEVSKYIVTMGADVVEAFKSLYRTVANKQWGSRPSIKKFAESGLLNPDDGLRVSLDVGDTATAEIFLKQNPTDIDKLLHEYIEKKNFKAVGLLGKYVRFQYKTSYTSNANIGLEDALAKNNYYDAVMYIKMGASNVNQLLLKYIQNVNKDHVHFLLENGATNIEEAKNVITYIKDRYNDRYGSEKRTVYDDISGLIFNNY